MAKAKDKEVKEALLNGFRLLHPDASEDELDTMVLEAVKKAAQPKPVASQFKDAPQYQILDKCFLSGIKILKGPFPKGVNEEATHDVFLDPETMAIDDETEERKPIIIEYLGIPGPHMKPLNDAARFMCEKYAAQYAANPNDAIDKLTMVTGPDVVPAKGA